MRTVRSLMLIGTMLMLLPVSAQVGSDSLRAVALNEATPDTIRLSAIDAMVNRFLYGDPDSAQHWAGVLEEVAQRSGNGHWQCRALNVFGILQFQQQRFAEARRYFEQALAVARASGNLADQANELSNIGNTYKETDRLRKAVEYYEQALKLASGLGNGPVTASILMNIAAVYSGEGKPSISNEYLDRAMKAGPKRQFVGAILYMQAVNLSTLDRYDEACGKFRVAMDSAEALGSTAMFADIEQNWGKALGEQGSWDSARVHVRRAIGWAQATGQAGIEQKAHSILADVEIRSGHLQQAERELDISRSMLADRTFGLDALILYQLYYELKKRQGDANAALRYFELLNQASDSLHANETQERLKDMELREEERADSISSVREQERSQAMLTRTRTISAASAFAALCGIIIAFLLLSRARLRRKLEVERVRTRLARDLHDDIGSTLSSINILSEVARQRVASSGDHDAAHALERISDRSQRLMREMSDIVWSVDPGKDSMKDLATRMREFASTVLEPKGIAFTLQASTPLPTDALSMEVKNNLYLIFKEAVNNAAKHSGCTTVTSELRCAPDRLSLMISDNGRGVVAANDDTQRGNGLQNMRRRAEEMRGTLALSSNGVGTRVTVEVPL